VTLKGRTFEEMRSEAVSLAVIYLRDARGTRDRPRVHASLLRKAAAQRKRASFLGYCIAARKR
jgi:hypothetical protein